MYAQKIPSSNQLLSHGFEKKGYLQDYADKLLINQYSQSSLNILEERAYRMDPCPLRVELEKRIQIRKIQLNPKLSYIAPWPDNKDGWNETDINEREIGISKKKAETDERKSGMSEKERNNSQTKTSKTVSSYINTSNQSQKFSGIFSRLISSFRLLSSQAHKAEQQNQIKSANNEKIQEERQQLLSHDLPAQRLPYSIQYDAKIAVDNVRKRIINKDQ